MITRRKFPWFGMQKWEHILFLHWPVQEEHLRSFVPEPFLIDTFAGSAWISLVIFQAKESTFRSFPVWLSYGPFYQMNVRTYVKHPQDLERGVYFLNLHINRCLAKFGARQLVSLPFHYLSIEWKEEAARQLFQGSLLEEAWIEGSFQPKEKIVKDAAATFLTERYCIWNVHRNKIIKIPILHTTWELFNVDVSLHTNRLLPLLDNQTEVHLTHYSPLKQSYLYPYETFGLYK